MDVDAEPRSGATLVIVANMASLLMAPGCLLGPLSASASGPAPASPAAGDQARSPEPRGRAPEPAWRDGERRRYVGVGYEIGDGLGYFGADLNLAPLEHLAVDVHFAWLPSDHGAAGLGLSPALRLFLNAAPMSTPYLSGGYAISGYRFDDGTRTTTDGVFGNIGYEWRWSSGLQLMLGGGILYRRKIVPVDPRTTIMGGDGARPNLEIAVRYMFL